MSEDNENDISVKVVLIGESGVGKTCIVKQFASNIFDPNTDVSISSQFNTKLMEIKDEKKKIRFDLWDTAGQEKYRSLAKIFYKDANIIIFVYEVISKKSFEELKNYWYNQVNSNCLANAVFAVVANKNDLYQTAAVLDKEGISWADEIGAIFQSTSAKTNAGIDQLFENVGKKILNPNYDYKSVDENDKKLYEIKKSNEQNKNKDTDDENFNENIPDVKNIKIDLRDNKKANNKKKCC
jgi:small GTP-binding protein